MSLAENLLNSITGEDNISTFTSNTQEEGHIVVGSDRRITVPAELRNIAIIGDKDVETVTIDCIRYWDGHDLSTFAIYLNYLLPNRNDGSYIPQNIRVSENQFSFDWTIERHMTAVAGAITISIGAIKTDENGVLLKQWGSFPNSDMIVSAGLPISNVVSEEEQKDVISQIAASLLQKVDRSDIVDSTGNAQNKVISQYGTTEAINNVVGRLEMAEKRIDNIEGGLSDESFVVKTDGLVPANSLPYARVLKVGGMTHRDATTNTLKDAKVTSIESRGANLIPFPYVDGSRKTTNGVTFTVQADGGIHAKGAPIDETLTVTFALCRGIEFADTSVWAKDSTETYGGKTFKDVNFSVSGVKSTYIEVPKTGNIDKIYYPMINEGETALPYMPYRGVIDTLAIPEAVQALDGNGLGVNAKYNNHISWEEDGTKKWNVYVKRKVFDGTEAVKIESVGTNGQNYVVYGFNCIDSGGTINCVSNRYTATTRYSVQSNSGKNTIICANQTGIRWYDDAETVDEMKAKLAAWYAEGNPLIVDYIVAEPITTDVSDLLPSDDNFIEVEGGGTIVAVNAENLDAPTEMRYQLKVV